MKSYSSEREQRVAKIQGTNETGDRGTYIAKELVQNFEYGS
jgi:hypothetical protein